MDNETPIVTGNFPRYCTLNTKPQLWVASAPANAVDAPRHDVQTPFVIGRHSDADLCVVEQQVSRVHLLITEHDDGGFVIEDRSTNGTFLNGRRLAEKSRLQHNDLIRIGNVVLVFHTTQHAIMDTLEDEGAYADFSGPFYRNRLIRQLKEAARSDRPILLTGPSGAGKELAARIVSRILSSDSRTPMPMVAHNAARFSSEADATTALFGVAAGTFTGVESRPGLIESARNSLLFLDEFHNLPERVQRSLLRVIEDKQLTRIGGVSGARASARFIFGANEPAPDYGLAPDLLARLRVVEVLPLSERIADIPTIFNHLLERALERHKVSSRKVMPFFCGEHYEMLCLDKFEKDNVRGIVDLADRLATRMAEGVAVELAIDSVFLERFGSGTPSTLSPPPTTTPDPDTAGPEVASSSFDSGYEAHKSLIIEAYSKSNNNVRETARRLKGGGFPCTRQTISDYLDKWGIRRKKKS